MNYLHDFPLLSTINLQIYLCVIIAHVNLNIDCIVALNMEVVKIRSQLSDILRSLQKHDQELERGRRVDAGIE